MISRISVGGREGEEGAGVSKGEHESSRSPTLIPCVPPVVFPPREDASGALWRATAPTAPPDDAWTLALPDKAHSLFWEVYRER